MWDLVLDVPSELGSPHLVTLGIEVKSVGGQFRAERVVVLALHLAEDVDVDDAPWFAVGLYQLVGNGYVVGAPRQGLPSARGFVDGQDAFDQEQGGGRLPADAVDERDDQVGYLLRRQTMAHVVDAGHEEDGAWVVGGNLAQAVEHADGVVADDAPVDDFCAGC